MEIMFISHKELTRVLNLKSEVKWNEFYTAHIDKLEKMNNKNAFWYVIYNLYLELNKYVIDFIDGKLTYNNYRLVSVSPRKIKEINKAFLKVNTKKSVINFFENLGYKTNVSNFFGDGDSISIHF